MDDFAGVYNFFSADIISPANDGYLSVLGGKGCANRCALAYLDLFVDNRAGYGGVCLDHSAAEYYGVFYNCALFDGDVVGKNGIFHRAVNLAAERIPMTFIFLV